MARIDENFCLCMNLKNFRYILLLFCALIFVCCKDDLKHSDKNVAPDDPSSFLDGKDCKYDFYDKRFSMEYFLYAFFANKESGFSLDDDLIMFDAVSGGFIYARNKDVNYIWSSECGVLEKLTSKQMSVVDSFVDEIIKNRKGKEVHDEFRHAVHEWSGKSKKGKLETFYTGFELSKTDYILYDYLVTQVFVHGCKIHPLYRKEYAPKYNP